MSLAWLRHHARHRHRGTTRLRCSNQRLVPHRFHNRLTSAKAYAPRVMYDCSFVVDSSVTCRDAIWESDDQYKRQYSRLDWEVVPIRKTGNCLFRALSDQLYGHERRHLELRRRLVDFIDLERAFFEPLVAIEGIVAYCARLREAGAWGGHPELVAASKLLGITIIVHIGPVKRLWIDMEKSARPTTEGKGKTINLLLQDDHYTSLRKKEDSLVQQHGCSNMCLCKRIVTPSRALLDPRAACSDCPLDLGLSSSDRNSDVSTQSPLQGRPPDIALDQRGRLKGAYGRKPVPDAPSSSNPFQTKRTKASVKPKSRPPPHLQKFKTLVHQPLPLSVPAEPTTSAPVALKVPAPARPMSPSNPKAITYTSVSISSLSGSRTKQKSPGVVLFLPESFKPAIDVTSPLVVLFKPDQASSEFPRPRKPVATPANPTTIAVVKPKAGQQESTSNGHETVRQSTVRRPRRAVFNGGKRHRSSVVAMSLLHEVSKSFNASAPENTLAKPVNPTVAEPVVKTVDPISLSNRVSAAKPNPLVPQVQIKKSSKKVFRQGRPVPAAC